MTLAPGEALALGHLTSGIGSLGEKWIQALFLHRQHKKNNEIVIMCYELQVQELAGELADFKIL